jgi:hypothetical protein
MKKYEINFLPEKSQKIRPVLLKSAFQEKSISAKKIYMLGREWKFAMTGTL